MVLANAFATTIAFVWTVCTFGVALFPGLSQTIGRWWLHGLSMSTMGTWRVSIESYVFGGLILVVFGWITGYVFALSLEAFSMKK